MGLEVPGKSKHGTEERQTKKAGKLIKTHEKMAYGGSLKIRAWYRGTANKKNGESRKKHVKRGSGGIRKIRAWYRRTGKNKRPKDAFAPSTDHHPRKQRTSIRGDPRGNLPPYPSECFGHSMNVASAQVVVVVHECICEETCSYTMHLIRQKHAYWISNLN